MKTQSFQHLNPVWRDKANYLIGAEVPPLKQFPDDKNWEQLWARRIKNNIFELCCIPLFSYGLALGDVVETDESFMIVRVIKKSGSDTIRIWFDEKISAEQKDEILNVISTLDCIQEWYSENFLGVNSISSTKTKTLIEALENYQKQGSAIFEIGNL
jgi:hypothetical protein